MREIEFHEEVGPQDVRIKLHTVGICASDVHYFTEGRIGDFIVNEPMILGHEASGTIVEIGPEVTNLSVGDRVCMEPGIPTAESIETKTGHYNLDAKMRFWATPPFHGVLRESVVHPAGYTYKLPDNVSFAEGAITAVNFASEDLGKVVAELTGGRGVNIVFECSGNRKVAESAFDNAAPGGTVIFVGLPDGPIQYDVLQGSVKEIRVEHVFRYTDVYDRAEALMGSGKIDVKPLLTDRYPFDRAVDAIHAFLNMAPNSVKIQIDMVSEI